MSERFEAKVLWCPLELAQYDNVALRPPCPLEVAVEPSTLHGSLLINNAMPVFLGSIQVQGQHQKITAVLYWVD